MPTISKQSRVSKPQAKSILDMIRPLNEDSGGIKLCVYGRGKTGKTRLACSFPKPLLLIGTEDGRKSVSTYEGGEFVRIRSSEDMDVIIKEARRKKWASLVLDTAGGYQDVVLKEVLGLDELPLQRSWGMAQRGDWLAVAAQWKERMSKFLALAESHAIHTIVIAHEKNFKEEGDSLDNLVPYIGASLTPSVAGWLNAECDYIGQMFIRDQVILKPSTKAVAKGKKPKYIKVQTGRKEYCLRTGPHHVFMTGFRLPEGVVLPDAIVNPTYDKIRALIYPSPAVGIDTPTNEG